MYIDTTVVWIVVLVSVTALGALGWLRDMNSDGTVEVFTKGLFKERRKDG